MTLVGGNQMVAVRVMTEEMNRLSPSPNTEANCSNIWRVPVTDLTRWSRPNPRHEIRAVHGFNVLVSTVPPPPHEQLTHEASWITLESSWRTSEFMWIAGQSYECCQAFKKLHDCPSVDNAKRLGMRP
jgi:hypothetical protein